MAVPVVSLLYARKLNDERRKKRVIHGDCDCGGDLLRAW